MHWILVLMLFTPPHGFAVTTLDQPSMARCLDVGEQMKKQLTVSRGKPGGWTHYVSRRVDYKCVEIIGK